MSSKLSEQNIQQMVGFLKEQQAKLLALFEDVNGSQERAQRRSWQRGGGGGGEMGVLRGEVVEKGACNVSRVYGEYPQLAEESERAGKAFFATGLSTIVHMYNPYAPIAHMNVRLFQVGDEFWFGGGADLTPFITFEEDTEDFHSTLKKVCLDHHPDGEGAYEKYRQWCDEYFYIHHRKEVRGVGGIFFDQLKGDFEALFPFVCAVCVRYREVLERILKRRCFMDFSEEQKEGQLYWRCRYVEFNLVYDRGTAFGLKSGGDLEAIFVSLPPVVKW